MPIRRAMIVAGADFSTTGLGPKKELWTPHEIASDILMWLYPTDASTLTLSGASVTQIASKESVFNLTNVVGGAAKPQYDITGFDGLPGLDFSAGTGLLTGCSLRGTGPLNDAGMMGFAVVKRLVQLDGGGVGIRPFMLAPVALRNAVRQQGYIAVWRPTIDPAATYLSAGQHTGVIASDSSIAGFDVNEVALVSGEFGNTSPSIKARINGAINPALPAPYFDAAASQYFVGSANNTNDSQAAFKMHQMLWTKPLDDATRQKLEGYMLWSALRQDLLPSNHPYKKNGPFVD